MAVWQMVLGNVHIDTDVSFFVNRSFNPIGSLFQSLCLNFSFST